MKKFQLIRRSTIVLMLFVELLSSASISSLRNVCGKALRSGGLIVGGGSAAEGTFPWLGIMCYGSSRQKCFCGATLITNDHAITAAHCFRPKKEDEVENPFWPTVSIHFGGINLKSGDFQSKRIKDVFIHEDWKIERRDESYDADIAILRLSSSVIFGRNVQPICLPSTQKYKGGTGTIVS